MKTMIIALAAATALTATAAAAQPYGYGRPDAPRAERWMTINERQAMLDRRIERGIQRGDLTRREAYNARATFQTIARLENRYRRNGLNEWERADLDRRFDALATQIRWDRRDGDRRYGANDYPRY
jgi:Ni/Co efflux regulator RcnB